MNKQIDGNDSFLQCYLNIWILHCNAKNIIYHQTYFQYQMMPSLDPPPILMKAKNWKVPELLKALRVNIVSHWAHIHTRVLNEPVLLPWSFCTGPLLSTPGGRGTPLLVRWGESDPSPSTQEFIPRWMTWKENVKVEGREMNIVFKPFESTCC